MCGIVVVMGPEPQGARRAVVQALQRLTHRGPDGEGLHVVRVGTAWAALGHRRLAIQDLSDAGRQPMVHPRSGDVLTYNGELFATDPIRSRLAASGAEFRGHSDTEVLLELFARGEGCAALDGIFAYALAQPRSGHLRLGRDPLGVKPLYWSVGNGWFVAASEVRAVVATGLVDPEIDRAALAGFLAYGSVCEPRTLIQGVSMVPPGTEASVQPDGDGCVRAAPLFRAVEATTPSVDPLEGMPTPDETRERIRRAVQSQLVGDVPVGLFLSSGLDSTVIAAAAALGGPANLRAFTLDLPLEGQRPDGEGASLVAHHLGLSHQRVILNEGQARAGALGWLAALDQPSVDGLNTYLVAQAASASGLTVALSGTGGDELFAGYRSARALPVALRALRAGRWIPAGLRRILARTVAPVVGGAPGRKLPDLAAARPDPVSIYLRLRRVLTDGAMTGLGLGPGTSSLDEDSLEPATRPYAESGLDPVAAACQLETDFYLRNTLLRDADVCGMAHGLEIRVPLLSVPLAQWARSLPGSSLLPRPTPSKPLLRAALDGELARMVGALPKQAFHLPLAQWIRGPLREPVDACLATVRRSGLVDAAGVDLVAGEFLCSSDPLAFSGVWTLTALGSWLENNHSTAGHWGPR